MLYTLEDLLTRMGAPEVREKGRIQWYYCDKATHEIAGFADIALDAGGDRLIAELKNFCPEYNDAHGCRHPAYVETFYLHAVRAGACYKVTRLAFDGEDYAHPSRAVIDLGLSIFHARVLNINILMIDQALNKDDILSIAPPANAGAEGGGFRDIPFPPKPALQPPSWGVVIPFPVRRSSARAS